ncbi:MAG TPA: D-alanine--D-alanine ligase [Nocardioidaceae bacterium]|nr:D-alanine--D-alanine ligase [Nocardioidaceae bacterium]
MTEPGSSPKSPAAPPPPNAGRVLVLAGGLSHERDVSLRAGRRVAEALRSAGMDVEVRDVDSTLVPALRSDPPACVFPLLYGESGEDGTLREVLELVGVPYVGSRPAASRLAFDKPVAKEVVSRAGLSTPDSVTLPHETFREVGATALMAALIDRLGQPLVVKPTRGGSALGCSVVAEAAEMPGAMVGCFAYGPFALVERFVRGTEVTVSVVDSGRGPQALPAVEIRPMEGTYDYSARYTAGATEFVAPAKLDDAEAAQIASMAVTAHEALGLSHLSRTDLIIDEAGVPWFLEVNVAPGMTETSLLPLAVEAAGLDLGQLCADLVAVAVAPPGVGTRID